MLDTSNPLPLWAQVRRSLQRRICEGEWSIGTMIPKEVALCEEYGVSRITVSRALQELVREGLVRRQRGIGTVVLSTAQRSDDHQKPSALTFVTSRGDAEWALDIYRGFENAASKGQHLAFLTSTGGMPSVGAELVKRVLSEHTRGLAVSHVLLDADAKEALPELRGRGVPVVFVGTFDPSVDCDRVTADNRTAGRIATEHLLSLGHRRVAFFGPDQARMDASTSLRDRRFGYWDAVREAGDSASGTELLNAVPRELDDTARLAHLQDFLHRSGATAGVTSNDMLAMLVMRYLQFGGLRVPEDFALVGISDSRLASLIDVPLTTVRLDAPGLGSQAARLLLQRLDGDQSPPQHAVLPVMLVVRDSCGARGSGAMNPPTYLAEDTIATLQMAMDG